MIDKDENYNHNKDCLAERKRRSRAISTLQRSQMNSHTSLLDKENLHDYQRELKVFGELLVVIPAAC